MEKGKYNILNFKLYYIIQESEQEIKEIVRIMEKLTINDNR